MALPFLDVPRVMAQAAPERTEPVGENWEGWNIKVDAKRDFVGSVAFSPDGNMLATGSQFFEGAAQLWGVATGRRIRRFGDRGADFGYSGAVAFSPDGKTLATEKSLWDVATGKEIRSFGLRLSLKTGDRYVAFSPDGRILATNQFGEHFLLWDLRTGKNWFDNATLGQQFYKLWAFAVDVDYLPIHLGSSVAFSPDSETLATGSNDHTARLWVVATGREIRRFEGHEREVVSVAFSPDGKTVATGSWDNTARLWDVATGKEIRRFDGHQYPVNSVAFSPDGKTLATDAGLFDVASGRDIALLFSFPDGEWLVLYGSGGYWGSADVHKHITIEKGKEVREMPDELRTRGFGPRSLDQVIKALKPQ